MKKLSLKALTLDLFIHKSRAYAIDFVDRYDDVSEQKGALWHAEVVHVAGSAVVVIACCGIGGAFFYDITNDRDSSNLYKNLKSHRFGHPLPDEIGVDDTSVVSISFTKSKECPAALAVENSKMMELLIYISDEFDHGSCNHTEIESRLEKFFR